MNENKIENDQKEKDSLTTLWSSIFNTGKSMKVSIWQKKVGLFFKALSESRNNANLNVLDLETGSLVEILLGYFYMPMPKKAGTLNQIGREFNKKIKDLFQLKIDGGGTIASLWNRHVARNPDDLTTTKIMEGYLTFSMSYLKQQQEVKLA